MTAVRCSVTASATVRGPWGVSLGCVCGWTYASHRACPLGCIVPWPISVTRRLRLRMDLRSTPCMPLAVYHWSLYHPDQCNPGATYADGRITAPHAHLPAPTKLVHWPTAVCLLPLYSLDPAHLGGNVPHRTYDSTSYDPDTTHGWRICAPRRTTGPDTVVTGCRVSCARSLGCIPPSGAATCDRRPGCVPPSTYALFLIRFAHDVHPLYGPTCTGLNQRSHMMSPSYDPF